MQWAGRMVMMCHTYVPDLPVHCFTHVLTAVGRDGGPIVVCRATKTLVGVLGAAQRDRGQ